MECTKCQETIIEFMECGNSVDSFPELSEHLKTCLDCRSEYDSIKGLFGILEHDRIRDIDDFRLNNIVVDINKKIESEKNLFRFKPQLINSFITALAAVLLIVIMGNWNNQNNGNGFDYLTEYMNELSVDEMIASGAIDTDNYGGLFTSMDEQSLNTLEDYWLEDSEYSTLLNQLDKTELEYIKLQLEEEKSNIS
ncbi:MAG: hypothetical protein GY855_13790 [candidate division Zixibacteria bacterium]|nr:hypothetical protein [candidate division Zixibacteria bacterium]